MRSLIALAVVLIGALATLVVTQRTARLQASYTLRRAIDRQGRLVNEVQWRRAELAKLLARPNLLATAKALGIEVEGKRGRTVKAPPQSIGGPGL